MESLNEQLWAVAKEYARQFGEIIGMEPEFCVGDCPSDMWCFGDTMFFSLEEMQQVVDDIAKYTRRYGSADAVGEEIRDWVNWWLDARHDEVAMRERVLPRVTGQLRVNINLKAWLDGCPREDRHPWSGPDAELMSLQNAEETIARLITEYRENRTLGNVLNNIRSKIKPLLEEKDIRDRDFYEKFIKKYHIDI